MLGLLHLLVLVLVLVLRLVLLLALNLLPVLSRTCSFWPFSHHTLVSGSVVLMGQIQAQSQLLQRASQL